MDATVEDSTGVQASDPPEPSATPRDFPEDTSAAVGPTENRSPDARPSGSEPSSGGESTPSPRAAPTDQPSAVTEASGESPLDGPAPAPGQETASVPEPRTEPSDTRPAITEATGPIAGIDPDTGPDAEEATTDTESTDVHEGDPASELDTGFQWAETASLDDDPETAVAESGSDTPTPETGADPLPGEATAADADPPPEPEPKPEADAEPPEIDPTGVSDTESVSTTDEDDGVTDVEPPDLPDLDELTEIDTDDLAGADPDVEDLPEAGNVGADLDASVDLDASLDTDERVDDGDPDTASASPPDAAEVGEPDVDLDDLNLDDIDLGDDTFGESDEDDSLTESTGGDGTGIAAGPDTGGDAGSAPELPDLGAISPSSEDDSFEGTFGDDETAAFESRFSAAFDEVEEAAEAAVASSRAALTIEESDLDGTAFGGRSMASTSSVRPGATGGVQTLSVDVKNADELLNLAERLTVSRLQLTEAIDPDDQAVEDALSTLESVASQFRTTVMDIRLMPLRRAVENLPRVVRDVARQSDVDVEFETEGTDVRLDRSVIDRVSDPLVHLVRNAVDHGIEPPDERREAGKEPTGTVRLTAERRRQEVVVEITDDGRGIDVDAVRARAVEEGDVTFEEAEALSEAEVYELLFRSGFSTAETVTETSGRGVGMDVVDRVLTELDGDVEIESTLGEGTTVRLTLPVNIAMSEVWIVESGGERYAIPADPVDGIEDASGAVRMDGEELFEAQPIGVADGGAPGGRAGPGRESESGPEVGSSAGERADEGGADDSTEPVPLIRLREAFDTPGERNEGGMVLRLRRSARNVAIHVDSVIDREEVVVKPYGELLGGVAGVSGATLRGDGRLVNVVDIESL
jgi:two-component system chemotaxis sensor kinase CheA